MAITSVIIDDEPHNTEALRGLLAAHCADVAVTATAQSAETGITAIKDKQPDLVFLDIQMPGDTGFDVLKKLAPVTFEVIFVTAFDQFGLQAIKFSALDYLLKPIDPGELKAAVAKARERIAARRKNLHIDNLLAYIREERGHTPRIALPTFEETLFVEVRQIVRCEASSNYTLVFLEEGARVLVSKTLKEFAEMLTVHHFARTHQSHLVNLAFVKSWLREDGGMLSMRDGTRIPISRQNRDAIKAMIDGYIRR